MIRHLYLLMVAIVFFTDLAEATVYTWTGGAGNGDWTNTGNWDANGVPVDTDPSQGLTFNNPASVIIFSAATLPSSNMPDLGGINNNNGVTPNLDLRSGGTLNVTLNGAIGGVVTRPATSRTVFTVGDGMGPSVTMDVTLTGDTLSRDPSGLTHNYRINSAGLLNFDSLLDFSNNPADRWATFTLDGGAVNVNGSVRDLTAHENNFVDLISTGAVFTAQYGNDFAMINDVLGEVQTGNSSFRSSTGLNLVATDNGDGTFTVNVNEGAPNQAPVFTDDPIIRPYATTNVNYSDTINGSATDADGDPLTYSKVSGPAWLSVSTNGLLSGVPTVGFVGLNSWTVRVSDGKGRVDDATLEIFVTDETPADVNVLIIGSTQDMSDHSRSFYWFGGDSDPFDPTDIATELENILSGAGLGTVHVALEERYAESPTALTTNPYAYSYNLASWFHFPFPADIETTNRWPNLRGMLGKPWDYVVLIEDPYTIENTPGLYAYGVAEIAEEVAKGSAETILLMSWPAYFSSSSVDHYKEVVYRTGRSGGIPVAPAALAWQAAGSPSTGGHPNADGAYIAAATLYSRMVGQNAKESTYTYDDSLADIAYDTVTNNIGKPQYSGDFSFQNPYLMLNDKRRDVHFSERGTSTEQGFRDKTAAAIARCKVSYNYSAYSDKYSSDTPEDDGLGWPTGSPMPISFNYGRDGIISEAYKAYVVNPDYWQVGFGYYYHYNTWYYTVEEANDHFIGSMVNQDNDLADRMIFSQGSSARNVPVRTLWAQIHKEYPTQNPLRDGGGPHLNYNEDEAVGTYMYTLYSGRCPLDPQPEPMTQTWFARKVGYETAWRLGRCSTRAPGFKVLPTAVTATDVTPTSTQTLSVQFIFAPRSNVTVAVTTDDPCAGQVSPGLLTFTPENHAVAQTVTVSGVTGPAGSYDFKAILTTSSDDVAYDGVTDSWEFRNTRPEGPPPTLVTANYSVPHAWLSGSNPGWSNDFEAAVMNDQDEDGFLTWEEYWSGTDPQDSNSYFKIDSIASEGTNTVLQWRHALVDAGIPSIVIESRTNLTSGSWNYGGEKIPVNGTNVWIDMISSNTHYRLSTSVAP